MARQRSKILSERELEIMNALWDLRRATVRDIRDKMGGQKAGAYTTISTMLKFLEKKNVVKHTIEGRTYYFEPRIGREHAGSQALRHVLRGFFRNDVIALMRTFLTKERITEDQKEEILSIIKSTRV